MQPARIIFAGAPEFAVAPLQALLAAHFDIVAVLTQPDRPAGRGRKLAVGPVKQAALDAGLPVLQPPALRAPEALDALRALRPDLLIVVAYGQILTTEALALPRLGCLNIHASLLPRWRGAAPIQAAIRAGDDQTGVCLMRMEAGLDTGPVYACRRTAIDPHETAGELHDRLSELGATLLVAQLPAILDGTLQPQPQAIDGVTYAGRIRKEDGRIDWQLDARQLDCLIRAYNPWPVAETTLAGEQLRCWRARPDAAPATAGALPGTILALDRAGVHVQTGNGVLVLEQVQLPGRKAVAAHTLTGSQLQVGRRLGT